MKTQERSARRRSSGLVLVGLFMLLVPPIITGQALSGVGTATIDGILSPGEWSSAGSVNLAINIPGGGTTSATLYVMNDAANLYVALKFVRNVVDAGNSLSFEFDSNGNGVLDHGDDGFILNPDLGFRDLVRWSQPPCPSGALCGLFDISVGGTNDGSGAFRNDGTFTVYEMSHPLNSGDNAHDFALAPGQTVGFFFDLRMISAGASWPQGFGDTRYPAFGFRQILIVQAAASQLVIDQQQPIINTARGVVIAIGGSSQQKLAQVVTVGVSGLLTGVRLPVSGSSGNLVVEIRGVSGNIPNATVLASQSLPASSIPSFFPSPPSFRSIFFSSPVPIAAGTRFAIVLWSTSSFSIYPGPIGDSYLGGNAYFDSRPNPPGVWVCECEFQNNSFDLPFQTLVQVADATPPTITCPTNIATTTSLGQCSRLVNYPAPIATDNQPGVTVTSNPPSGSNFPKGVTSVRCTARDAAGNTASCSFTVTVLDNEAPSVTAPAAVTSSTGPDASGCGVVIPDSGLGVALATDNCAWTVTIKRDGVPPGNFFPVGITTITYTATDASGNTATSTQDVTVNDKTPPTIAIPTNSIEIWPPDHRYVTIDLAQVLVSANDNCDRSLLNSNVYISSVICDEPDDAAGDGDGSTVNDVVNASNCKSVALRAERDGTGNGRVYTINLEVMDASGNVGTASYRVSVPHDRSVHSPAVDDGPDHVVLSTCGSSSISFPKAETKAASSKAVVPKNEVEKVSGFQLYDNYPNPFNPSTRIAFELPVGAYVSLKIYNALGQEVATLVNEEKSAGRYEVTWDASNLPSGVYFYRIQAGAFSGMKKLLLLK